MRHYGKPLTSFVIKTSVHCSGKGLSTLVSSESPSETLQSPVSAAATINFAQMQPKAANDC